MDSFSWNKKQLILLILLLFLMAAIPVTIYLSRQTQIFKPKANEGNSCSMNIAENQPVSGTNFHITVTGTKLDPSSYLAVWIINAKGGGSFSTGATQANSVNTTINTAAVFENGPGIIECRIQTARDGGATLASSRVTVNVYNDPTTAQTPSLPYSCNISGPTVVAPGQQVTWQYTPTNNAPPSLTFYNWFNLVSDPYNFYSSNSGVYTFTAPTYTGYFSQAVTLLVNRGQAVCYKDLIVSNNESGTLTPGESWVLCSREGSTSLINGQRLGAYCRFNGTGTVRYGREPVWYTKTEIPGEIGCNNQTFGYVNVDEATDPNAQKVKHCEYLYQGGAVSVPSPQPGSSVESGLPINTAPSASPGTGGPVRTGCTPSQGDANGDGRANGLDFSTWSSEFLSGVVSRADFNCDTRVNGIDFSIWSSAFLQQTN